MIGGVAAAPWMECESFAFEGLALSPEAEHDFFTNGHALRPSHPRSNPAPRSRPPCSPARTPREGISPQRVPPPPPSSSDSEEEEAGGGDDDARITGLPNEVLGVLFSQLEFAEVRPPSTRPNPQTLTPNLQP